jgi:hypothetical protein
MYYYSNTLSLTHSLTNFKVSEAIYIYIYISMKKFVINCLAPMPHVCADAPYMCPIYVQEKKLVINCLAPMPPRSPCTR